jgi:hypothetical protein
MDLFGLVRGLQADGSFTRVVNNPRAQFGTPGRRYLGATILPERPVRQNAYREDQLVYRSIIANATTRYSPVQLKGGVYTGWVQVQLAESDIGSELTSRDFDALRTLTGVNSMDAAARLINFADITLNIPMVEWNERARWQAIDNFSVVLTGDNDYLETVPLQVPSGHNVAAGGSWSNDSYDPMTDIFALADLLTAKGFPPTRAITSRQVATILAGNDKIKTRTSRIAVAPGGTITTTTGRVTLDEINQIFNADGLPTIETYDLMYRTNTGVGRFKAADKFTMIGATGLQEQVDLGDVIEPIDDVLGYVGQGIPAGQDNPGRRVLVRAFDDKPPRVEGQGWQTSFPVVTVAEARAVIHTIT